MKFSIVYERTVRVREYETFKLGIVKEFDMANTDETTAVNVCEFIVDTEVEEVLNRLREEV